MYSGVFVVVVALFWFGFFCLCSVLFCFVLLSHNISDTQCGLFLRLHDIPSVLMEKA